MAGKTVVDKVQFGNSGTPANNFLFSVDNAGSLKVQRGNDGGSLTDVLTIDSNGKITSAYDIAAGQLALTANGYAKLANGLILQWGQGTGSASAAVTVTRPIVFPNGALRDFASINAANAGFMVETGASNATNFVVETFTATSTRGAAAFNWLSIGY